MRGSALLKKHITAMTLFLTEDFPLCVRKLSTGTEAQHNCLL